MSADERMEQMEGSAPAADTGPTSSDEPNLNAAFGDVARIGRLLRHKRAEKGFTVERLAASAGVSAGLVSELERGRANPSFINVWKISSALGVSIGELMTDHPSPAKILVRASERKRLSLPDEHLVYELLTPDLQRNLEVTRIQVPSGYDNSESPFIHLGEEAVHLLEGSLEVWWGKHHFSMTAGDTATWDPSIPHWWKNISSLAAVVFCAVTPPSF